LAHLPGGFAAEPSAQAYLHKRRNIDFGAAQPGQVQPLLSIQRHVNDPIAIESMN
jgi:hypothetical protein